MFMQQHVSVSDKTVQHKTDTNIMFLSLILSDVFRNGVDAGHNLSDMGMNCSNSI